MWPGVVIQAANQAYCTPRPAIERERLTKARTIGDLVSKTKREKQGCWMATWIEVLATKPGNRSPIPGAHVKPGLGSPLSRMMCMHRWKFPWAGMHNMWGRKGEKEASAPGVVCTPWVPAPGSTGRCTSVSSRTQQDQDQLGLHRASASTNKYNSHQKVEKEGKQTQIVGLGVENKLQLESWIIPEVYKDKNSCLSFLCAGRSHCNTTSTV